MKRIKLIVILTSLVAATACVVAASLHFIHPGSVKMSNKLRMALEFSGSVKTLDPTTIVTLTQYQLLRNLYGRLVDYNEKSQLVADVPESFSWTTDEVTFVFGNKVKTNDVHVMTARDAELSLKRVVLKQKSGHGDIRRFLCPGFKLASLNDACPGIRVEGNKLILKVVDPTFLPLLIATLESADYSIIPETALDLSRTDAPIIDYRNSSGPYYVSKDSERGAVQLAANPHHFLYSNEMPQALQVVPVGMFDGIKAFNENSVDLLTTTQAFLGPEAAALLADKSNDVHETLPLKVTLFRFSNKALHDFTPEQRMFAALVLDRATAKILNHKIEHGTVQFFQALSDGTLTAEQTAKVEAMRAFTQPPKFPRPIVARTFPEYYDALVAELKGYPQFRVEKTEVSAFNLPEEKRPDIYPMANDSSWSENISLLGYNFEIGVFQLPGLDVERWFQDYLQTKEKVERITKLNQLHFDLLMNASFVPTEVTPYNAVVRKPWKLNQSTFSASTDLWRMRTN